MAPLFGRRWRLVAGVGAKAVEVDTNLRVAFKVERHHKPEPAEGRIDVYNLSEESRSRLSQTFERELGADFTRPVVASLEAGYQDASPLIFQGGIERVYHQREGADWVTVLEAADGATKVARQRVQLAVQKGARVTDVFGQVAKSMGVGVGSSLQQFVEDKFGRQLQAFAHGLTIAGSARESMDRITKAAGVEWSVQNEELVITKKGEPLPGQAVVLAPDTGLVASPEPGEKGIVRCKALIQPGLEPARRVQLRSRSCNGFYRVERVVYDGDSHGSSWYAELDLKPAA